MSEDFEVRVKQSDQPRGFIKRLLVTVGVVFAVLLVLLLLWYAVDVLALVFAGVLLAVFLCGLSDLVSRYTPLSGGWSLAVVIVLLVGLLGLGGWLLAPQVAEQVDQLTDTLPRSVRQLGERIERYGWGRRILAEVPPVNEMMPNGEDALARATGIFSTTFGVLADVVIILFIGIYLAAEPRLYSGGLVRLVPLRHRPRAEEVLGAVGYTLRWWLLGRAISMLFVGVLTWLGLWLLGVPLALTLGIIAALLAFVPYIGPIVAAVPGILLALTVSPVQALYVGLLYFGIETIESYVVTPIVQQRTAELPPALTITTQVLLSVLLGTLGLIVATPLTAAMMVAVKMLYVEDALGDPVEIKGFDERGTGNAGRQSAAGESLA